MSSVSEPLAPTSESVDSTVADSITNAAEASADALPATDSTPTDNPADPAPVEADPAPVEADTAAAAGIATVTPDNASAPARPKKKRRWLRVVGMVAAGLAIVTMTGATGYVADHHHVHNGVYPEPTSTYVSPPSAKPSAADRKARNHSGDLRRFLLPKPPSAERLIDNEAPNGTMSLSQMAYYFENKKSGAEYLQESGYKIGATTLWKDKAGNVVVIRLSRFSTDNQAYAYYSGQLGNVSDSIDTKNTKPTTVRRIPFQAATVFSGGKAKHGVITGKGIAYLGDVMIEIWVDQKAPESPDLIAGLLYQQWNRL
jgi:hypothetical protein